MSTHAVTNSSFSSIPLLRWISKRRGKASRNDALPETKSAETIKATTTTSNFKKPGSLNGSAALSARSSRPSVKSWSVNSSPAGVRKAPVAAKLKQATIFSIPSSTDLDVSWTSGTPVMPRERFPSLGTSSGKQIPAGMKPIAIQPHETWSLPRCRSSNVEEKSASFSSLLLYGTARKTRSHSAAATTILASAAVKQPFSISSEDSVFMAQGSAPPLPVSPLAAAVAVKRPPLFTEDLAPPMDSLKHNGSDKSNVASRSSSATERDIKAAQSLLNLPSREQRKKSTHSVKETKSIDDIRDRQKLQDLTSHLKKSLNIDSIEGSINQYVIIREIGEGSFSKVFLVLNTEDGRYYACKAISKKKLRRKNLWSNGPQRKRKSSSISPGSAESALVSSPAAVPSETKKVDFVDLVRREIAILKRISKHVHIATLVEVLEDEASDLLYMVFELCEYGSIMNISLNQTVPCFTEALAKRYFRGIVLGLEYLHHLKIVHNDIKPDNILLNVQNQAIIGDFSISFCSDEYPFEAPCNGNANLLTPAFTPPELIAEGGVTANHGFRPSIDIWALGVTLFCFVHGRLPFEAASVDELYVKISKDSLSKSSLSMELSKNLQNLLVRLLDKNPQTRITLDEIRVHPWVLSNSKPLPTKEENCQQLCAPTEQDIQNAVKPAAIKLMDRFKKRIRNLTHKAGE